jgi:hypothetical protein
MLQTPVDERARERFAQQSLAHGTFPDDPGLRDLDDPHARARERADSGAPLLPGERICRETLEALVGRDDALARGARDWIHIFRAARDRCLAGRCADRACLGGQRCAFSSARVKSRPDRSGSERSRADENA